MTAAKLRTPDFTCNEYGFPKGWAADRALIAELVVALRDGEQAVSSMVTVLENYRDSSSFNARLDSWISAFAFTGEKMRAALAAAESQA